MRKTNNLSPLLYLLGGILLTGSLISSAHAQSPQLSQDDCIKCHEKPPQDIAAAGGAHKSKVSCIDCHQGHPPKVNKADIIPACSNCHQGADHYKLQGCTGCHTNPHTPLNISFPDGLTAPCLTCHTGQIEQLKKHASKHTTLACSSCHQKKHKAIPDCAQCHAPHLKGQVQKDCLTCHKPHMPKEVTYPENTPSAACAACHDQADKQLKANPTKHTTLECAVCHQAKHKMIPKCSGCHGDTPHPAPMHAKFPQCGQCHGIAHNLNK